MKKLMLACAVLMAASSVFADAATDKPKRRRPVGKPSGGIVEKPYSGNVLRVLNTQKDISAEEMAKLTESMRWTSLIPVEVVNGEVAPDACPMEAAAKLVAEQKVGAGVVIVDNAKLPIILSSADAKWAILNMAPLKADAPDANKLTERFTKVYWCAMARSLGVGNSGYQGCVLAPFTTVKELDRIGVRQPCPEPFNKMIDAAAAYGIRTLSIASYRTACEQGWAQKPDTPVRQSIWDEVHKLPTEPIVIKPEVKPVQE